MYKVLIVDDDELERNGLMSLDLFSQMNMQIEAEAWNGQQALELFEHVKPDIVISDIRMPIMDGLTLTRIIKERRSNVKIILMSGYEDFTAAQQAVYIGAEAYVLKPLNITELTNVLKQIVNDIDVENNSNAEVRRLQARAEALQPMVREQLMRDLLLDIRSMSNPQTKQEVSNMGLFMGDEKLVVFNIQIGDLAAGKNQHHCIQIMDLMKKMSNSYSEMHLIAVQNNLLAMIITLPARLDDEKAFEYLENKAKDIFDMLREETSCDITIAISNIGVMAEQLNVLYTQAMSALQKQIIYNTNRIYWYEDTQNVPVPLPKTNIVAEDIQNCMITNDRQRLINTIASLCNSIRNANASFETIHAMCLELLSRFTIIASENGKDFLSVFNTRQVPYKLILEMESLSDIQQYLIEVFQNAMKDLYAHQSTRTERMVEQAKEIIQQQYDQDISADTIAHEIFIAPSHLRRIFKNLTGQTIHDYILAIRMSKARELLFNPELKVYEVAQAVGYNNHSYFCITFKKYYGTTPGEYRHGTSNIR